MNEGTLASVLIWFFFLFWIAGWFEEWRKTIGVSNRQIIASVIIGVLSFRLVVELTFQIDLNVGGFLLPFVASLYFWYRTKDDNHLHLFSQAVLIAISVIFMRKIFVLDPVLIVMNPLGLLSLLVVALSFNHFKRPQSFFTVVTMGLCFQEISYQSMLLTHVNKVTLGEAYFRDLLWLTYMTGWMARLLYQWQVQFMGIWKKRLMRKKVPAWKNIRLR